MRCLSWGSSTAAAAKFNLAAMRGNEEAKRYRHELSSDMSKADIAKAQKLAREWMKSLH